LASGHAVAVPSLVTLDIALAIGGHNAKAVLQLGASAPKAVWISNLAEEQEAAVPGSVDVPANGLVTLRAELPE
jgi:hypothetical protein